MILLKLVYFYLFFTLSAMLIMFPFTLSNQEIMPLYLASRYIEFGTFFQRLDAAFLLIMNIAICSFLGIYGNLCLGIIKEITGITDSKPLSYPLILLFYAITVFIDSFFELEFIQDTIFKIIFFSVVSLGIIILVFANIKSKFSKRKANI